jgi:hypothetical protein
VVPARDSPALRQRTSSPAPVNTQNGLSKEEIIIMIAGYRGHDEGLAGQNRRSLLSLLKHYEIRLYREKWR